MSHKNEITLSDGTAVILIVLYHSIQMLNSQEAIFLRSTLRIQVLGLVLFTFISGYKFVLNHVDELKDKDFLKKYFIKRIIRLYKPYIGYSLLVFVPELIGIYLATHYFKISFGGINYFLNSLNVSGLINFIFGVNFIAQHLWYLFSLIIITAVCFTVLYYGNIYLLFTISIIMSLFIIINSMYLNKSISLIDERTIYYMPIFIFGMFWAYYKEKTYINSCLYFMSVLFIALIIQTINYNQILGQSYIIAYGLTFPCFMILFSKTILKIKYVNNILLFCGRHSFEIYLFHVPIILPTIEGSITSILNINSFFVPYFSVALTLLFSVYIYTICIKMKLNKLFE